MTVAPGKEERIQSDGRELVTEAFKLQETEEIQRAEAAALWSSKRRGLAGGPGSYPPHCSEKCGDCSPCKPVHVAVPPGAPVIAEYYPEAWRCKSDRVRVQTRTRPSRVRSPTRGLLPRLSLSPSSCAWESLVPSQRTRRGGGQTGDGSGGGGDDSGWGGDGSGGGGDGGGGAPVSPNPFFSFLLLLLFPLRCSLPFPLLS
ncbi:EPIDERMAL PATTERNING FACTOR-like protein 6 [Nymphaea thermarum]|nr:EPIDERMAL PATTERNING FACTOR-like protein 6 [Nymphaea thermarum]